MTESVSVHTVADGVARVTWRAEVVDLGLVDAVARVQPYVDRALAEHGRVEAWVRPDDVASQRIATWTGLRREGVMRGAVAEEDRIVFARLAADPPSSEPEGFRALLNSFLPRKRAISQLLVRDHEHRVLLCQLTYKPDWDLPGGVVEVGESPQLAVSREVSEELGLELSAGPLLLTDWLPPWSGWDDALCLVFDGGSHRPTLLDSIVREKREIRAAEFCTLDQVAERCAEFTARRVAAALANLDGGAPAYVESGRPRQPPH
ncbi:NUDIX hydrolase [Nocardioides sp.]|uniref:NUDIX hydrolase n=1 Tax=Nocardioides sp. TaxID=35761 RepID=UPI002ED035D2